MRVKWGKCPDCDPNDKDKPLVAKRCKYHNDLFKQSKKEEKPNKPRKAINKVSDKEAARIRKYSKIRAKWIVEHELCEMRIVLDCSFYATDVHHMKGKIGDLLFDTRWWKAGCRICHRYVEDHPEEAKEKGLSLNRQ